MARPLLCPRSMSNGGAAGGRRALVAEDDDQLRAVVAGALRAEGFDVDEVSDGAQMLLRAMEGAGIVTAGYALIVSDVRMPFLDGITVIDRLRGFGMRTPVVLISAFGDEWARVKAKTLDAVLMDKPFKVPELRSAARRLVDGSPTPSPAPV